MVRLSDGSVVNNSSLYHKYNKGAGGGAVPSVQIMENDLECLGDRKGHDGYYAEKLLKKYYS